MTRLIKISIEKAFFVIFPFFILLGVIALSVTRPLIPWDSWAYHFPFSAQLLQINNYSQSFILDKTMQARYEGFPVMAEFLQGLLWLLTGRLSATALINSVSLTIFIGCASRYGKVSFSLWVFGILSIPMIAFHALSTYIDLFLGVGIAFQYLSAVIIFRNVQEGQKYTHLIVWQCIYVLAAFMMGNTKMWAPVMSLAMSLFLFLAMFLGRKKYLSKNIFYQIIFTLVIASILSSGSLIKNSIVHKNPIYPIEFTVNNLDIHLQGPEIGYQNEPGYAENYGILRRPIYFVLSITELDWTIRGVKPFYNLDMGTVEKPKNYSPARAGGWWGIDIALSISLVFILWVSAKFKIISCGSVSFFPISLFCFLTVITALMPQSHELRYFLYWPILLIFNLAFLVRGLDLNRLVSVALTILYAGLFFYSLFILRGETIESMLSYQTEQELIGIPANSAEIVAAKRLGGTCLGLSYAPNQFKYSAVLQGGRYFIEQGWSGCTHYPEFTK